MYASTKFSVSHLSVYEVTGRRGFDGVFGGRAGSSDALDSRAKEGEGGKATHPCHGGAVGLVSFCG